MTGTSRRASRWRSLVLFAVAVPFTAGWSFFDPFHENVEKGNRKAQDGEAEQALERYGEAARVDPSSPIPDFNRGIVLSEQGNAAEALDAFRAATVSEDAAVAADALYNMGNVYMETEQYEPAIDAYLKSLDLDPDDTDARRNFEIALQRLQQQQEQQQQQDRNEEQNEDEESEDEQPQSQDEREEPEEPQEPQEDEQQQSPDQPQEEEEQQPQPDEERLSREDAERLLNAVQSDELKVLEQLQQKEPAKGVVAHDW